ncbi:MAG TPA: hypothetical protein PLY76_13935 [Flavobacteriales bacterium]|nr:hypothetical protein [Flavobacteriales bacterium]HRP82992.1 hypothetical protein [Flavobacteriales bacterium]
MSILPSRSLPIRCKRSPRAAAGLALVILASCSGPKSLQPGADRKINCNLQADHQYAAGDLPVALHEVAVEPLLTGHFSKASLNVANSIGVLDLLGEYTRLKQKQRAIPSLEQKVELLELSHTITQRIDLASLEISSVTAELDCEEERISQIADYLTARSRTAETRLTVAAIAVGAFGSMTPIILDGKQADRAGLAAGIAEAALGAMILLNDRKVNVQHPRNALSDIWEGPQTSRVFPPFVWYYLNYRDPGDQASVSLRTKIIDQWKGFGQVERLKPKEQASHQELYFGNGGRYDTDQLYNRANMYDQLESSIKLIKQDLTQLALELGGLQ